MKKIKLVVAKREETGTGASKRLRKSGFIPGVIYGRSGSENLQVSFADFRKMMQIVGDRAALVELSMGSSTKLSIVQATQRNVQTDNFEHIDFKEVSANEEMQATLPVHLKGESYGVKNEGGVLDFLLHSVEVRCLPDNLPEYIELDVTELKAGESMHIGVLPQMKGVSYTQSKDLVVVACTKAKEEGAEESAENAPASTGASESTV